MTKPLKLLATFLLLLVVGLIFLYAPPRVANVPIPMSDAAVAKGEYLVHAAGCISCHLDTDGTDALSGGEALVSEFGTFYAPNITPDKDTGIADWTGKDFIRALKHGRSPGYGFYYPAFPYRSYHGMTDEDVVAIAAYLMAQPAVQSAVPDHQLRFWLNHLLMAFWNKLADLAEPEYPLIDDEQLQRGAYLARNLAHCGGCHTPRKGLGIPDFNREYAGATLIDGEVDAITKEALQGWSEEDFSLFLLLGLKPDGEYVGGDMEPVIENTSSALTDLDRQALAAFFISGQ